MNFNLILNEDYLAFYILSRKMYNESAEISNIKNKLLKNNDLGYQKVLKQEVLDLSIYLDNNDIKKLVKEFIDTDKFNQIYKIYNNESKENIAIKILKGFIQINDDELENVKNELWEKNIDSYRNLLNIGTYNPADFLKDKDVINTINYLKSTNEFKKLYKETELYINNVKRYCEKNKDRINSFLKRILKLDLDINLNVYMSHPNCYKGYAYGENNIAWGHYKGIEDPNYNLTYLVHEGLHHLLLVKINNNDSIHHYNIKHTIIELISDYELYSLLKKESTLNHGHSHLEEYKKIIYPYWLRYIGLSDYQIRERLEKDSIDIDNYVQIGDTNEFNMNIHEFINFLIIEWDNIIRASKKIIK